MLTVDSSCCCCPSCPTCCPHWFHFVSRKLLQPVSSKISFPLLTSITHPLSLSNYRHLDSSTSTLLIGYTWRDYHSIGGKKNSSKWPTSTCPLLPLSDPVSHSISNTEHRSWEEECVAREEERMGEREGQWTDERFLDLRYGMNKGRPTTVIPKTARPSNKKGVKTYVHP